MVHINRLMSKISSAPVDSSQSQVKSSGQDAEVSSRAFNAEQARKEDKSATANDEKPPVDVGRVKEAADKMERSAALSNSKIRYVIDERTEKLVVKIIDKETNEEIRQIPPKEMLNLAANREKTGLILDKKI